MKHYKLRFTEGLLFRKLESMNVHQSIIQIAFCREKRGMERERKEDEGNKERRGGVGVKG